MNALTNAIKEVLDYKFSDQDKIKEFLRKDNDPQRYIIGRNSDAAEVIKLIKFSAVIDDGNDAPSSWNGIPIIKMADAKTSGWVLNCSTSIAPVSVLNNLKNQRIEKVINLYELWHHPEFKNLPLPWFVKQQREDILANQIQWEQLYNCLEDQESKQTLLDTLRYRLSANPKYMASYSVRLHKQYFESFLKLNGETFVDAGGFDGDSSEIFCGHDANYKRVFFFEPSEKNLTDAKKRLLHLRDINWMPFGLSDTSGYLAFDPEAGSASSVQVAGDHTIRVAKLDDCLIEPVSFIKMDLEGWELHALEGSQVQIKNNQPKLAIAVYHDASHFREVWKKITTWNPGYKVRLRHYTQGWSETVMYFSIN
jgi:FkbM family methyltransferase